MNDEVATAAERYLLENFILPPGGNLKDVACTDIDGNQEDPSSADCWPQHIQSITFSGGVLYLHVDDLWPEPSNLYATPDGKQMLNAERAVGSLLRLGPGPRIVMDNVHYIEAMDRVGNVRDLSKVPLTE